MRKTRSFILHNYLCFLLSGPYIFILGATVVKGRDKAVAVTGREDP
jgi:hypothetical protein